MKNSHQNSDPTLPTLSRIPCRHSAVSLRELSRRPYRHSAVRPYGNSAVTIPKLSRRRTAEFPCKHRHTAQVFKHRFNLTAQTTQVDLYKHSDAASSAPAARDWLSGSSPCKSATQTKTIEAYTHER